MTRRSSKLRSLSHIWDGRSMDSTTIISFPDCSPTSSSATSNVALVALCAPRILFATQKPRSASCLHCIPLFITFPSPFPQSYCPGKLRGSMKLFLRAVFVIAGLQSVVVYISIFTCIEKNGPPPTDSIEYVGALIGAPGALGSSSLG